MPTPVLYLDLQPKNLLLYKNTIKLIDFDHAVYADEAERLAERYGTAGCAAPEQYTGDVLDGRTDIYAIGAVLHYMLTGHFPGEPVRPEQVLSLIHILVDHVAVRKGLPCMIFSLEMSKEQLVNRMPVSYTHLAGPCFFPCL